MINWFIQVLALHPHIMSSHWSAYDRVDGKQKINTEKSSYDKVIFAYKYLLTIAHP